MDAGESGQARVDQLAGREAELAAQLANVRQRRRRLEAGVDGEREVAALLAALPHEWRVLHDRRKRANSPANIDHLVIGPPGVFVIDAKNWSGPVRVSRDKLWCGRRSRDDEVTAVLDQVAAVKSTVSGGPCPVPVEAVMALTQPASLGEITSHRGVTLAPASELVSFLAAMPDALTPQDAFRLWERLDDAHPPRVGIQRQVPEARSVLTPRRVVQQRRSRSRRTRNPAREAAVGLGRMAGVVLVLLVGIGLVSKFAGEVGSRAAEGIKRSIVAEPSGSHAAPMTGATSHGAKAGLRGCDKLPASVASVSLHLTVKAHPVRDDVCEFVSPKLHRPAAVVASGPEVTASRWADLVATVYGVPSCGQFENWFGGIRSGACVNPGLRTVSTAGMIAFDNQMINLARS